MLDKSYARVRSFISLHTLDMVVICVLLLVGYVYTDNIEKILDIELRDESVYLYNGLQLAYTVLPSAQYAPVYALWYYILSLFQPHAVELYFLNYKLMTVLPAVMLFVALRKYSVSPLIALVAATLFLFNYVNFPTWPKVSHFTVLVLLFGFFLSGFVQNPQRKTALLMVVALCAAYIRPEFFLSAVILAAILVFLSIRVFKSTRSLQNTLPLLLATLLPCLAIVICLGEPTSDGNRSMIAFGQHYAYNWTIWHNDTQNNSWANWPAIIQADFGNAQTPFEALQNNPLAVTRHIVQNLHWLPVEIGTLFKFRYASGYAAKFAFAAGLFIIAAAGIMHMQRQELMRAKNHLYANWITLRFQTLLLAIILLPVMISLLVIAPRRHYIYLFGALLLFGTTTLLFRNTERQAGHSSYVVIGLLCITLLLTTMPLSSYTKIPEQENLSTIKYLRSLALTKPVRMLELDGGYYIYAGPRYRRVGTYNQTTPFADFLATKSVNMIVVSDTMTKDINYRNNPAWQTFTQNPSQLGFIKLQVPDTKNRSVFISKELFETRQGQE